jgi:hypothetical protein
VTLADTPSDVLVVCNAADGDFVTSGSSTAVFHDQQWAAPDGTGAGVNEYVPITSAGDGMALDVWEEPYADGTITFVNTNSMTSIRVHAVPRTEYTTTVTWDTHAGNKSLFYGPGDTSRALNKSVFLRLQQDGNKSLFYAGM